MSIEETIAIVVRRELAALLEPMIPRIAEAVTKRTSEVDEPMQSLGKILGISPRAALGRLSRDPALRALALRVGRRMMFRPSEVRALFAQRTRERLGLASATEPTE